MTEITLLYDIRNLLYTNTWATLGGTFVSFVALIVAVIALIRTIKNGKN